MRRIEFHSVAESELEEILEWYAVRSFDTARRFLFRVEAVLAAVASAPSRYPTAGRTLRRAIVGGFPYAIYFRIESPAVRIVGILHLRRDPELWQERDT